MQTQETGPTTETDSVQQTNWLARVFTAHRAGQIRDRHYPVLVRYQSFDEWAYPSRNRTTDSIHAGLVEGAD
jgi:hypothetical protein